MEAREPLLHFGSQFGIRLGVLLHHLVPLGFLLGALARDLGGLLIDGGIDMKDLSGSMPRFSLSARTLSTPRGSPCAEFLPSLAGQCAPILVVTTISEGRGSFLAA